MDDTLTSFAESVLLEADPGAADDPEVYAEMVKSFVQSIATMLQRRQIDAMTVEQIQMLNQLLDRTPDDGIAVQDLVAKALPHQKHIVASVLVEFRARYVHLDLSGLPVGRWAKTTSAGLRFIIELKPDGTLAEHSVDDDSTSWSGSWMRQGSAVVLQIGDYVAVLNRTELNYPHYAGLERRGQESNGTVELSCWLPL